MYTAETIETLTLAEASEHKFCRVQCHNAARAAILRGFNREEFVAQYPETNRRTAGTLYDYAATQTKPR